MSKSALRWRIALILRDLEDEVQANQSVQATEARLAAKSWRSSR